MSDFEIESDYAYAQSMDNEMLAEEERMLADPAPYEATVAENPLAAEEGLLASERMESYNQQYFDETFNSEERTDEAITGFDDGIRE